MRAGICLILGAIVSGCSTVVPPIEENGIAISEIVQRVKCELAYSVPDFRNPYPSGDYQWMKYWTAKVDLSLDVNDQSSVKPNSSYTAPVTLGSFAIGAGADLSTQAQRTEKLSFTLSIKELVENRASTNCLFWFQQGLLGNLGLNEWVVSALSPAENRQLTIGYHQPPGGKPATIPIPGPATDDAPELNAPPAKKLLVQSMTALRIGEKGALMASGEAADARRKALKSRFQATYNAVDRTYGLVEASSKSLDDAGRLAWQATSVDRDAGQKLATPDSETLKKIPQAVKDAAEEISKAKQVATSAWDLLPHDAPIDSISHTAKFVVTHGGNITPNWTLVKFKGPGLASPFASASRTRTNQLDVVLGMPAVAGGKALSDEQNRQLFNIQLDALRRSIVVVP